MAFDGREREPLSTSVRKHWTNWERAFANVPLNRLHVDLPTPRQLFRSHDRCSANAIIFFAKRHVRSLVFDFQIGVTTAVGRCGRVWLSPVGCQPDGRPMPEETAGAASRLASLTRMPPLEVRYLSKRAEKPLVDGYQM